MDAELIAKKRDLVNHLSELRELSIRELGIRSGYSMDESETMAVESFKIFFLGRNRVTLYDGVEKCLAKLKEKYSLGVITNGNANPLDLWIDIITAFVFFENG